MNFIKNRTVLILILLDATLLACAYWAAYLIRFDGHLDPVYRQVVILTIAPCIVLKIGIFASLKLYRGMWRYTGINDLVALIKASVVGSFAFVVYLAMFHHFDGMPRSVLIVDGILTVFLLGGLRLAIRICLQSKVGFLPAVRSVFAKSKSDLKRVLIFGTGVLAERLLREITNDVFCGMCVVGFVDETGSRKGMRINGTPILGGLDSIGNIVHYFKINEILLASSENCPKLSERLVEECAKYRIGLKIVPPLNERLVSGALSELRAIRVDDLLNREPVEIQMDQVGRELCGKCVLVTGAGGSIGSEIARQVISYEPSKLILVDNAETPLYRIDLELTGANVATTVIPCIGDVRSTKSLDRIIRRYQPAIIYHAAAYKHVPMMELAPLDAIYNNILGTYKLAQLACKYSVSKFMMISTDKAVRPTSIMGATKRVAEMVVQSLNGRGTCFAVVRFGNVLGSNGSVVPLFEQQIAAGGPVTVTHPDVTRFFMTIPEAVTLVLQAGAICSGGELFLLDMGEPVKIVDLARKMIRLSGFVPDDDIEIKFVGLRPGEKLYEELLIDDEGVVGTAYDKIKVCNNSSSVGLDELHSAVRELSNLVETGGDDHAALSILKRLVPAYSGSQV